ncbi:GyrI-like domain-containing protein [Kocuria sp. M1R5S2]|uniref:GyrI-like domain-containing protein n=1 Tax=Kocuria rhizosphaerae TaxID=3376285 RepID=UPI0037AEEEED
MGDNSDGSGRTGDVSGKVDVDFRIVDVPDQSLAVVTGQVPVAELRSFFDRAFQDLSRGMADGGFEPSGPPLSLYRGVPVEAADLEVGFPVLGSVRPSGPVAEGRIPASRAVMTVHRGNYDALGDSWGRLAEWARRQELVLDELLWEVYVTEPHPGDDPKDMVTELYWALRP